MLTFNRRRFPNHIRFCTSILLLNCICLAAIVPSLARGRSPEQPKLKRHALLVGIDKYAPVSEYLQGAEAALHSPEIFGPPRRTAFQDLHGAKNDVSARK